MGGRERRKKNKEKKLLRETAFTADCFFFSACLFALREDIRYSIYIFVLSVVIVSVCQAVTLTMVFFFQGIAWVYFLFKFARNFICKLNTMKKRFFCLSVPKPLFTFFSSVFFSFLIQPCVVSFPGRKYTKAAKKPNEKRVTKLLG